MQRKLVSDMKTDVDVCIKTLPVNQFDDETGFVFILNKDAPIETKNWLVAKFTKALLNISIVSPYSDSIDTDSDLILFVTCSLDALILNVRNVYIPQQLRRQSTNDDPYDFNVSEKQRILLYILEKINSTTRSTLCGLTNVSLYPGQSIGR